MKIFIKKIILFFLASFIGYVCFLAFLAFTLPYDYANQFKINYKNTVGHSFTRFNEVKEVENIDVLFIGPSTTYLGFDPRIFEKHCIESFNLGSSAQTPIQTHVLLKRYLNKLDPKLVVYNPEPGFFEHMGIESTTDLISNDTIDTHLLSMIFNYSNLTIWNTLLYTSIRRILKLGDSYQQDRIERFDTYIDRGYVSRSVDVSLDNGDINPVTIDTNSWNPLPIQKEYFKKNIDLLKNHNGDFILIETPKRSISALKSEVNNPKIDSYLETFGRYINYNNELNMESSHFADNVHLNQRGVDHFNRMILSGPEFQKITCQ